MGLEVGGDREGCPGALPEVAGARSLGGEGVQSEQE